MSLKRKPFSSNAAKWCCTKYWPKLSNNQWPIILAAGLYTTFRGERALVYIRFNATILRPYCEKICNTLLNDAEILTTCGFVLWCSQIVYIRCCSWNTTTALYFVTQCSDLAVLFRFEGVCMPQYFRTPPGLDQGWTQCPTLDVVLYQVLRVSEQYC